MNWENDALFSSERPTTRRREGSRFLSAGFENDEISLDEDLEHSIGLNDAGIGMSQQSPQYNNPTLLNRSGGWANEDIKSSKRRTISSTLGQRFQSANLTRSPYESDDDISNIPELDEYENNRPLSEYKPSAPANQVATFEELEAATPQYLKVDGINLNVLTKCLCIDDEENVDEDKVMTWDTLFAEVASYFLAAELNEQKDEDDNDDDDASRRPASSNARDSDA